MSNNNSSATLEVGQSIDLQQYYENMDRRAFLKSSTAIAAGALSLPALVQRAYGAKPEGKTIVHTRDRKGRPAKVRVVDPERYRRLKVYENYSSKALTDGASPINGLTITQRSSDPTDLALKFLVEKETALSNLPDSVEGMPVEHEVERSEAHPEDLEGGSEVNSPHDGTNDGYDGTATFVCYDQDTEVEKVLTAYHVTTGDSDIYYNGSDVGNLTEGEAANDGNGMDVAAYALGSVNTDPNGTLIGDVSGWWTFSGLSDATSGSKVAATGYGATSGQVNNEVRRTNKNDILEYQAAFNKNQDPTSGGDSGMPWLDDDDYLICHHHGDKVTWLGERWNIGGVAEQVLEVANATLDPNACDARK
jgi:hypothetical protein